MVPPHKVLAAIDFSEFSLLALETAFNILPEGDLSKLYLLHVLEIPRSIDPIGVLQPSIEEMEAEARERLEDLIPLNREASTQVENLVERGSPAQTIADVAKQVEADLIVVGTHGRSGLARVLLGSTAETLLRRAPCMVLVVKPHPEE